LPAGVVCSCQLAVVFFVSGAGKIVDCHGAEQMLFALDSLHSSLLKALAGSRHFFASDAALVRLFALVEILLGAAVLWTGLRWTSWTSWTETPAPMLFDGIFSEISHTSFFFYLTGILMLPFHHSPLFLARTSSIVRLRCLACVFCATILLFQQFALSESAFAQSAFAQSTHSDAVLAPDFTVENISASKPTTVRLSELRGNIVILEFWATWCAPCRLAMKHLDTLAQAFKREPVRFLAITKESSSLVRRFAKSNPSPMWLSLDAEAKAHKLYKVDDIPHTVVIGKDGRILAVTEPDEITADRLRALLDGHQQDVKFAPLVDAEDFVQREEQLFAALPAPKSVLKPFDARGGLSRSLFMPQYAGNSLQAVTLLILLYSEAHQIPLKYIKPESPELVRERYYLQIELTTNDRQALRDTLKSLCARELTVTIDTSLEKEKVYYLRKTGANTALQPSSASAVALQQTDSSYAGTRQPIATLAAYLSQRCGLPVVDRTGLPHAYNIQLLQHTGTLESMKEPLARYGLELVEAQRPLPIYVVQKKNEKKAENSGGK
jgi:uncharacterized protein (TIGR03435 family)